LVLDPGITRCRYAGDVGRGHGEGRGQDPEASALPNAGVDVQLSNASVIGSNVVESLEVEPLNLITGV
jgi:hypothetical protein